MCRSPYWAGMFLIVTLLTPSLLLIPPVILVPMFAVFQGIPVCDLPEDTMLPGEM